MTLTPTLYAVLVSAFCSAGALWAGTLFSVSWLSGRAQWMADGPEIGRLALSLYRRWTTTSMFVSLAAGIGWLACTPAVRTTGPWFLGAGAAALGALAALHATVGARVERIVRGHAGATSGEGVRRLALLVTFAAVVAMASLRASLEP